MLLHDVHMPLSDLSVLAHCEDAKVDNNLRNY